MKVIVSIIGIYFLIASCFADTWTSTNCSSSDGAIKWEQGTANEGVTLKYSNFVEGNLELDLEQVNFIIEKTIVFSEEHYQDKEITAVKKVTVLKTKVTASEKHPDILKSQFPENKVEGDVICTSITIRKEDGDLPSTSH